MAEIHSDALKAGAVANRTSIAHILSYIPDLAKASGIESNVLARKFLHSRGDDYLDDTTDLLVWMDSVLRDISTRIGWTEEKKREEGKWACVIYNRPKRGRIVGNCYSNARAEHRETGNPTYIGLEGAFLGNVIYFTPHAFNYDPKTKEFYDTDTPRTAKRLPERIGLIFMGPKESWNYLKSDRDPWGFHKEDFAQTRGEWIVMRPEATKAIVVRYCTTNITMPTEKRTVIYSSIHDYA